MNARISIIVPIYKVEPYIRNCVDSILGQTFTDFELILVNDGSPDECGKICDGYAQKDNRVKVIHKENGGLSSARNAGLDIATGDYIGFIDGDDYIEKDMYELLYQLAIENDADVAECSMNIIKGNDIQPIENHGRTEVGDNIFALKRLLELPYRNVAFNKLYKKEIFHNLRYPDKLYEDGFLAYKIFFKLNRYVFTGKGKYNYIKREGSIMDQQKAYTLRNLDGLEVQEERYYFLKNKISEQSILLLAEYHFFNQIIFHYKMMQLNKQVDPDRKYRDILRRKVIQNFSGFMSNPKLGQYRNLIKASKSNIIMFDKIYLGYQRYLNYLNYIAEIKYSLKKLLAR